MPLLTSESATYLLKAAKWGKFLAILGFIVAGLMLVAGIAMIFVFNTLTDEMVPLNLPFPPAVFSVFYLLIAVIYVIPVTFLNRFCNNAIKALNNSSTDNLTISIRNLKNLFIFIGITTIVVLVIYTVVIIFAATAALTSI